MPVAELLAKTTAEKLATAVKQNSDPCNVLEWDINNLTGLRNGRRI